MAKVKIEKFIDGKHETSFSVPAFVLGVAKTLLPESALSSLANSGINVREILEAKDKGIAYAASVDVREHGVVLDADAADAAELAASPRRRSVTWTWLGAPGDGASSSHS